PYPIHVVRDGQEALNYLSGEGQYANRVTYPMPNLVLLDLKLPKVTGLDVLKWIREQPGALGTLPVIVLSSSNMPQDVARAHALGIDRYWTKSPEIDALNGLIEAVRLRLDSIK